MSNSVNHLTGECIGYCSIVPETNEVHMFGDAEYRFKYAVNGTLYFVPVNQQIENNFKYHAPKEGQPEKYSAIRAKAKELAELIDDMVPKSREQSLAMTNLEQAVFWANAAIARNE